ncbi:hypothetical protein NA57DRAFT_77370 [Rhizodiscina lignyota]|uniref:Methyltransferase type 11 domain-containing protein n=1 Tax=Rhizodiscina lignyota TaxID=1504668 RepID=A0A9P4I8S2_9PEZI|nr:hypothetical protein NA57DRAFT_77370 [Rhizodiscina lignyota]
MFTADLTWDTGPTEKVGERRERKERQRAESVNSGDQARPSSTSSGRRWLKSKKPSEVSATAIPSSTYAPISHPETTSTLPLSSPAPGYVGEAITPSRTRSRKQSRASRKAVPPPDPLNAKDPLEQPDWTLSATLNSGRLPSGAPLDPPRSLTRPSSSRPGYHGQINPNYTFDQKASHQQWVALLKAHDQSTQIPYGQGQEERVRPSYESRDDSEEVLLPSEQSISRTTGVRVSGEENCTDGPYELPAWDVRTRTSLVPMSPQNSPLPVRNRLPLHGQGHRRLRSVSSAYFVETRPMSSAPGLERKDEPNAVPSPAQLTSLSIPMEALSLDWNDSDFLPRTAVDQVSNQSDWKPPNDWEIMESSKGESEESCRTSSLTSSYPDDSSTHNSSRTAEQSHFQRFVGRMESAGPKVVLDRLKEDWNGPVDDTTRDELELEKHLWALTALQLKNLDRFAQSAQNIIMLPQPDAASKRRRRILELGGKLAELYQLSAIFPTAAIHHLTLSTRVPSPTSIPLPSQITHTHTVAATTCNEPSTLLPLPYASSTLTHIRSSVLPALLPVAQVPDLLWECHRVLMPGGVLELRIVEPLPERGTAGPKMRAWLDGHCNLERQFRNSRLSTLIEGWVGGAGFRVLGTKGEREGREHGLQRCLRLPAAVASEVEGRVVSTSASSSRTASGWFDEGALIDGYADPDVDAQVGSLVLRALWRDVWGAFVYTSSENRSARWWWQDNELLRECAEWGTVWELGTLVATKAAS